ncbi:dienelactone hydrolase family protein [Burkholderiaceae bacterium FT117]|uniref:dienelactone hydrolase family protein n=1 Tax=Zeimonas sediminis TaxID=2944268 RepID=UPI002342D92A|nr:alpha/beta family hydrolase [Zeimonas sediminis]MCM5570122.1 dienelactone hydrolase family protein [Zeimonas sediminis]
MEILIDVPALERGLPGTLTVPASARGIVAFAHGSGSSRLSPRNRYVAEVLQQRGIATLLFDLLTPQEDRDPEARFDIPLLTERLLAATDWLARQDAVSALPLGYFGASTGAAAALEAAAAPGSRVAAVVSRGGRPDLARAGLLEAVAAPTLLIVGGFDDVVIGLNRKAMARMRCENELVIVPGATHLFEEPGTLAQAAGHAADWFARWFG